MLSKIVVILFSKIGFLIDSFTELGPVRLKTIFGEKSDINSETLCSFSKFKLIVFITWFFFKFTCANFF